MRITICSDQNAPAEILRDAIRVGRGLMDRGHAVSFIAGDAVTLVASAGSWVPSDLYQAPIRPAPPKLVMKPPFIDGFADLMAMAGFDDKATLITLSAIWNRQLLALNPDAIVGFATPVLWLVGPSLAPTFALGNGWTLPVALGTSFARLSADSVPLADEKLMLANANTVLLRHGGQPSLAALSEIQERCTSMLYGVPKFDPYAHVRTTPSTGLLGEEPTPTVPPAPERLAVFLDVNCPNIEQIILAVASLDQIPVDICVTGATISMRRFLEQQPQINVWNDYASLLAEAANASALVHHGVQDVAQRCISLGRPQLIIPWTHEQEVFNATVQWLGFTWSKSPTVSLEEMAGTLSGILRDTSLVVAAQHHARQLANANLPDALPRVIEQIERVTRS
jgi:hypothetical protein